MPSKWPSKYWLLMIPILALSAWLSQSEERSDRFLFTQPRAGAFRISVTTTGFLQAKNATNIMGPKKSRDIGLYEMKIQKLVPEGTVVEKGDFVAELDKADLMKAIEEARTRFQQLEAEFVQAQLDSSLSLTKARDAIVTLRAGMDLARIEKAESIYEPRSVQRKAEMDLVNAERAFELETKSYETQVQQAKIKLQYAFVNLEDASEYLEEAQQLLDEYTIYAPAAGMVIYQRDWRDEPITTGHTLDGWDPIIATLPDFSVMESVTYVNEVDIEKIAPGQAVEIVLDARSTTTYAGKVTKVANIGEQTRSAEGTVFRVTIEVSASDSTLRPAMTTSNTIIISELGHVLSVPLECIHAMDSVHYVIIQEGDRLFRQEVILGRLNQNEAEIKSDLSPDARLLLSLPENYETLPLTRI